MPNPGGGTANLTGRPGGATALSNIPIPDPSIITQQAIDRTKNELKEDYRALVGGLKNEVDINHRNREQSLAAQSALVNEKFNVVGEKFNRVDERFKAIDTVFGERRTQSVEDKAAADKFTLERSNFNAEAVRKSEEGFKARIAALETAVGTTNTNLTTNLNDLKDRIVRLETAKLVSQESRVDNRMTVGTAVGVAGGVLGLMMLIIASLQLYTNSSHLSPTAALPDGAASVNSKRVDDLIAQQLQQNSTINSRLDALSARLTGVPAVPQVPRQPAP